MKVTRRGVSLGSVARLNHQIPKVVHNTPLSSRKRLKSPQTGISREGAKLGQYAILYLSSSTSFSTLNQLVTPEFTAKPSVDTKIRPVLASLVIFHAGLDVHSLPSEKTMFTFEEISTCFWVWFEGMNFTGMLSSVSIGVWSCLLYTSPSPRD